MSTEWHNITVPEEYNRHLLYRDLIPDWELLNRTQRKKHKKKVRMNIDDPMNSLDCCSTTVRDFKMGDPVFIGFPQEETRNDMYNQASATIAVTAVKDNSLSYVKDRLDKVNWTKIGEIQEKFRNPYPKNVKEAKKWLAEGYLHFPEAKDEESEYCGWEWGKDTSKESLAAYDALKKAYADAYDTVSIMSDETVRLKALQDFEAFVVA